MNHAHHWVIDTPNGALSQGKCRHCGAEQLFRNSEQDTPSSPWTATGTTARASRARKRSVLRDWNPMDRRDAQSLPRPVHR